MVESIRWNPIINISSLVKVRFLKSTGLTYVQACAIKFTVRRVDSVRSKLGAISHAHWDSCAVTGSDFPRW